MISLGKVFKIVRVLTCVFVPTQCFGTLNTGNNKFKFYMYGIIMDVWKSHRNGLRLN